MARRGGRAVTQPGDGPSGAGAGGEGKGRSQASAKPRPPAWEPEVWAEVPSGQVPPRGADRPGGRRSRPARLSEEVLAELRRGVPPAQAGRLAPRLAAAVTAYERDRYDDALRALGPVASAAPGVAAVRELLGLTLYRMGRWRAALGELEAFHALTGSLDQHPVMADCHRALRHWKAVDELWRELRQASPGGELVAEGRIVAAGAMADRGDLAGAIALLRRAAPSRRRARPHDLRTSYALAGLYERAGDIPRARQLLRLIADHDPDFVDVSERLAALS